MHRLATVHAHDNQPTNQPTTNDQRRHDTAYLNKRLFTKVKWGAYKLIDKHVVEVCTGVTPPTAKSWLSVVRCVCENRVYTL